MKILLCSVPVEPVSKKLDRKRTEGSMPINPKVGIFTIIQYFVKQGIVESDIDFVDMDVLYPSDKEITDLLLESKPDIIGLSGVVSTSYQQIKRISQIARKLFPDVTIVVGGGIAASYQVILQRTDVDYCIQGDGEIALYSLVNVLETAEPVSVDRLKEIQGLSFLVNGQVYSNGFGLQQPQEQIQYHSLDWVKKGLKGRQELLASHVRPARDSGLFTLDQRVDAFIDAPLATIYTTKGCVAKCTFCQRASKGYRTIPIEDIRYYIEQLIDEFGIRFINISDENWGSHREHAHQVAELMKEYDLYWAATGVRVTSVTPEDLRFYHAHNCSCLKFGVESGSQNILDLMEKKFDVQQVYTALTSCIEIGLHSPMAVMLGMPGETTRSVLETGSFIGQISAALGVPPDGMEIDIFYALPLLDTPLYEYGKLVGMIGSEVGEEEQYLEDMANSAAYKRYYINLSGESILDVISWDTLLKMRASRTCRKLMKKNGGELLNPEISKRLLENLKHKLATNTHMTLANKNIFSSFIDKRMVGSRIVDRLPEAVVFTLVRWMLYLEYWIDYQTGRYDTALYRDNRGQRVKPLDIFRLGEKKKSRSLRTVVRNLT